MNTENVYQKKRRRVAYFLMPFFMFHLAPVEAFAQSDRPQPSSRAEFPKFVTTGSAAASVTPEVHEYVLGGDALADPVWSADGSRLATHTAYKTNLIIWNNSGYPIHEFQDLRPGAEGQTAVFLDGGKRILTAPASSSPTDTAFMVFGVPSGVVEAAPVGPKPGFDYDSNMAQDYSISADQKFLATTYTYGNSRIDLWSLENFKVVATIDDPDRFQKDFISSVTISRDAKFFAVGTAGGRVLVYDVPSKRLVSEHVGFGTPFDSTSKIIRQIEFSPDHSMIAITPINEQLTGRGPFPVGWTNTPLRVMRTLTGAIVESGKVTSQSMLAVHWYDNDILAYLPIDGRMRYLDVTEPQHDEPASINIKVSDFSFSSDGRLLALCHGRFLTILKSSKD